MSGFPIADLLTLPSAELWPYTVAVAALDVDPFCSICLDVANGARALLCGHVFCAVCIHRCLRAAEADPMLEKCPVCMEGELSLKSLKRCEVIHERSSVNSFTLVLTPSNDALPPYQDDTEAFTSRIQLATGEGMMRLIEKERVEFAACKAELKRFRDSQGLEILSQLEAELDKHHVEWNRQVGRRKVDETSAKTAAIAKDQGWCYQRADGALDFLHPLNLRCLLVNAKGDLAGLPRTVKPLSVREVEDWSGKSLKFSAMLKLSPVQVPDSALLLRLFEVELGGMSEEAMQSVAKEEKERARRREGKEMRKLKIQQAALEQELTIEEQRRKAREAEEEMIRAFFGFEQRRAEDEAREARERPKPAVNSFSAVVSNMGHFPALQTTASKTPPSTSPSLEPLRPSGNVWGTSPPPSSSLGSSPPGSVSFAQAATQGPGKKVLWQNNPGRRSQW